MFETIEYHYVTYILIGVAVILAAEALFLTFSNSTSYRRQINSRLRIADAFADRQQALAALRRRRSLTAEGRYQLPLIWFNRLVTQSGMAIEARVLLALMAGLVSAAFAIVYWMERDPLFSSVIAICAGVLVPLQVVRMKRNSRMRQFEAQLPDGVDVMVRSLRAGHPIPVSISMVAREMPDPIGSEFGIAFDELTYGMDLDTAMGNMRARVGQEDLALMVVAISIQGKTGGNLAEMLHNLSKVLRERFKMRRKVRALSAEGRFSALGLSLLPFLVGGIIFVTAPTYYSEVWDDPWFYPALTVAIIMMVIGDYIMYRMVNFRF